MLACWYVLYIPRCPHAEHVAHNTEIKEMLYKVPITPCCLKKQLYDDHAPGNNCSGQGQSNENFLRFFQKSIPPLPLTNRLKNCKEFADLFKFKQKISDSPGAKKNPPRHGSPGSDIPVSQSPWSLIPRGVNFFNLK